MIFFREKLYFIATKDFFYFLGKIFYCKRLLNKAITPLFHYFSRMAIKAVST